VLLGEYARQLGLTQALNAVPLQQKVRTHRPHTKVIEFLVAILGGLPHLEDISRDGHPLDQDGAVALAWQQSAWADYSGVSRTLQGLSMSEAQAHGGKSLCRVQYSVRNQGLSVVFAAIQTL